MAAAPPHTHSLGQGCLGGPVPRRYASSIPPFSFPIPLLFSLSCSRLSSKRHVPVSCPEFRTVPVEATMVGGPSCHLPDRPSLRLLTRLPGPDRLPRVGTRGPAITPPSPPSGLPGLSTSGRCPRPCLKMTVTTPPWLCFSSNIHHT